MTIISRTPGLLHRSAPNLPSGWVNSRSGLIATHRAKGRKVWVSCAEDGCDGCPEKDHFLMEWGEAALAIDRRPVGASEWTGTLHEGIERYQELIEGNE